MTLNPEQAAFIRQILAQLSISPASPEAEKTVAMVKSIMAATEENASDES